MLNLIDGYFINFIDINEFNDSLTNTSFFDSESTNNSSHNTNNSGNNINAPDNSQSDFPTEETLNKEIKECKRIIKKNFKMLHEIEADQRELKEWAEEYKEELDDIREAEKNDEASTRKIKILELKIAALKDTDDSIEEKSVSIANDVRNAYETMWEKQEQLEELKESEE
jgi:predicted RNase H-like nuclease (RuvC/YqgF family)